MGIQRSTLLNKSQEKLPRKKITLEQFVLVKLQSLFTYVLCKKSLKMSKGSETVNPWTENTIVNVFIILLKITLNHIQSDSTIPACRDIRWNILDYVIGFWSYRGMINVYQFGQISVKRSRHMIKQQEINIQKLTCNAR